MKRIISIILTCLLVLTTFVPSFATETSMDDGIKVLSKESVEYLTSKGVKKADIKKLDVHSLESLIGQADAHDFTDDQICKYVKGLLKEEKKDFSYSKESTEIDEHGNIVTANGTFPNLFKDRKIDSKESEGNINLEAPMSYTSSVSTLLKPEDQTGTYWIVKSEYGYDEATAFAKLPTIQSMASSDRAYMFFAVNTYPSSIIGDYGVVYHPSYGWMPFSNTTAWNPSKGAYDDTDWKTGNIISSSVTDIYLHVDVTNTSSTDSVKLRVLNGNDFSDVLWERTVYFSGNPISSSCSNLNLYREITMAQANNGTLNTNTGSWFTNAIFSNSYIYKPGAYYQWGTSQTDKAYKCGPTSSSLNTIHLNSYNKWYEENVSIRYNVQ